MPASLELKVTISQELKVPQENVTIGSMSSVKAAFSARLNAVIDENGYPPKGSGRQEAIAKKFGVSQKGARKWLEAESIPQMTTLCEIANTMGVSAEWLLTGRGKKYPDDPTNNIGEEKAQYILTGRGLNIKKIPLISSVQAGEWKEAREPTCIEEWIETTAKISADAFALRVVGDSMANPYGHPSIPEGAVVIVDPNAEAVSGKIVIAKLTSLNEVTIKRLIIDGPNKYLKPLNPDYKPIQVQDDCIVIGVVKRVEIDL